MIVCEGGKTEPIYLEGVKRISERVVIELVIVNETATSPKQIVDRAVSEKKSSTTHARRGRDPNLAIEHVWCIFDVDEHKFLHEAKQKAESNGVHCAISNPCIELWFLLHFQNQTAYIERDEAMRALRKHVKDYSKGDLDPVCMRGRFTVAKERAEALARKHEGDQTNFPENNPSSDVWRLIDFMCGGY